MKQNNLALTFQLEQYRAIFKSPYIRGLASAIALTAGGVSSYAHAAAGDGSLNVDEWLDSLKSGNGTVTITGVATDIQFVGDVFPVRDNRGKADVEFFCYFFID